jgi:hypothetical protein
LIYKFNAIPIKIQQDLIDILTIKYIRKASETNRKKNLKKSKVGVLVISDFKNYYKATAIRTVKH